MLKLYYQIYQYDKNCQLIKRHRKRKSRSFVKYFITAMATAMEGASYATNNINGTNQSLNGSGNDFCRLVLTPTSGLDSNQINFWGIGHNSNTVELSGSQYNGIVIGTGSSAITSTDSALAAIINHGISSGKMKYYGCWSYNLTFGASTGAFDIERIFYNGSGGSITINEMGVYTGGEGSSQNNVFCMIRDLVSPAVTVLNGEYLKIKYTLQITV